MPAHPPFTAGARARLGEGEKRGAEAAETARALPSDPPLGLGFFCLFLLHGWMGKTGNDPSAGSPTETLLRLLLPLDSQV